MTRKDVCENIFFCNLGDLTFADLATPHSVFCLHDRNHYFDINYWGVFRSATCFKISANREQISCSVLLSVIQSWFELCTLLILALSLDFSSIVTLQAEPQSPPSKGPSLPMSVVLRKEEDGKQGDMTILNTSATDVTKPLSPPSLTPAPTPAAAQTCKVESELEKQRVEERVEEVEERKRNVNEEPRNKPLWLDDDDLPPMMWDARWTLFACVFITPLLRFSSATHAVCVGFT